jgi:recombination endonuclease VII
VKATCPGGATGPCGKVVGVITLATAPPRLANHRRPAGGNCSASGERVRKSDLIHPCKRCATLPVRHPGIDLGADGFRPLEPRPVKARGYCASHLRDVIAEERQRGRDQRRAKGYGLTPERFAELVAAQGDACACGSEHRRSRTRDSSAAGAAMALAVDHDHDRQAECVRLGRHGPETACEHCIRGALGRRCNQEIIGRFTSAQLRKLADYMDTPTAQRLGWWDDDEQEK